MKMTDLLQLSKKYFKMKESRGYAEFLNDLQ